MIRINLIPILMAIKNKYGQDELLKKIKIIFNIDLSNLINSKTDIDLEINRIIIKTDKLRYTIELHEDYYTYTKDYDSYKIIKHYDYTNTSIRSSAAFKTSDNELLVLDEIDEENIKNRRIIKTTEDDPEFLKGYFEKEELKYQNEPISEKYNYLEDESNNKRISKQVKMPNNLYIYSYRSTINSINRDYNYGYIESAACINKPQILAPGRIREKKELLISSIKTPFPNIIIRGCNIFPNENNNQELYTISIYKKANSIKITIRTIYLPENIQATEEFFIKSNSSNQFTIEDLDLLLDFISRNIDTAYIHEIKQEIINIKNQLLINKNEKTKDLDFFDRRFIMFREFDYLACDIYNNLSRYEEVIAKQLKKENGEIPPTLKKV